MKIELLGKIVSVATPNRKPFSIQSDADTAVISFSELTGKAEDVQHTAAAVYGELSMTVRTLLAKKLRFGQGFRITIESIDDPNS